jgi:alcohol dehydrogenase, propanol-preferring
VDGTFATHMLAAASHAQHIPASLPLEQAAPILCAGVTTFKGLKCTEVRPGRHPSVTLSRGFRGQHICLPYRFSMRLAGLHRCSPQNEE